MPHCTEEERDLLDKLMLVGVDSVSASARRLNIEFECGYPDDNPIGYRIDCNGFDLNTSFMRVVMKAKT